MSDERRGSHDSLGQHIGYMEEENADLRQQLAAQAAEIERLRKEMKPLVDELDQVKDLREQDAYAHSQECGKYEVELAALRERLAAENSLQQLSDDLMGPGVGWLPPASTSTETKGKG